MWATGHGHEAIVRILVAAGANTDNFGGEVRLLISREYFNFFFTNTNEFRKAKSVLHS